MAAVQPGSRVKSNKIWAAGEPPSLTHHAGRNADADARWAQARNSFLMIAYR
jgi:hypothetical protein